MNKKKLILIAALVTGAAFLFHAATVKCYSVNNFISYSPETVLEFNITAQKAKKISGVIPRWIHYFYPKITASAVIFSDSEKEPLIILDVHKLYFIIRPFLFFLEKESDIHMFRFSEDCLYIEPRKNIYLISKDISLIREALTISSENLCFEKNDDYQTLKKHSAGTDIFVFSDMYNTMHSLPSTPVSPLLNAVPLKPFGADIIIKDNQLECRMFTEGSTENELIFSNIETFLRGFSYFGEKFTLSNGIPASVISSSTPGLELVWCSINNSVHLSPSRMYLASMTSLENTYIHPVYIYLDQNFTNSVIHEFCMQKGYDPKPFLNLVHSVNGEIYASGNFFSMNMYIDLTWPKNQFSVR